MIYKFKFVSDEVVNFAREIEIDSESSFLILRNAILDSVDYSKDELDSFLICDDDWEGHEEVTLEDMGTSSDKDIWLMDDTPIADLVEEEGQKLRFIFDYLTERSFFMELVDMRSGSMSAPICCLKKGNPPVQSVSIDEFEKKVDTLISTSVDDLDNDFYGDTEFNEDELAEGYDDLNIN